MEVVMVYLITSIILTTIGVVGYLFDDDGLSAVLCAIITIVTMQTALYLTNDIKSNYTSNEVLIDQNASVNTKEFNIYKLNHTN